MSGIVSSHPSTPLCGVWGLVGAGAWDTDVASFPEPAMARYGRVGAPGSPWWVLVKRSDKDTD